MTRTEFLNKLDELLKDIPVEEREEALQFYQNYFDDAGIENEQAVILELESPEKVAKLIKADIEEFSGEHGEYTENGYQDERFENHQMPMKKGYRYQQAKWSEQQEQSEPVSEETSDSEEHKPWTNKTLKVILIIVLILFASPLIFGVGAGAFGVLAGLLGAIVGVLCGLVGLSIGLVVGSIGILISGIIVVIAGAVKMFTVMPVGVLTIGIGIILMVLGIEATAGTIKLSLIVYPAMFRAMINLCRKLFHRKEAVQQ